MGNSGGVDYAFESVGDENSPEDELGLDPVIHSNIPAAKTMSIEARRAGYDVVRAVGHADWAATGLRQLSLHRSVMTGAVFPKGSRYAGTC